VWLEERGFCPKANEKKRMSMAPYSSPAASSAIGGLKAILYTYSLDAHSYNSLAVSIMGIWGKLSALAAYRLKHVASVSSKA